MRRHYLAFSGTLPKMATSPELAVLTATPKLPIYQELLQAGKEMGLPVYIWDANLMTACVPGGVSLEGKPLDLTNIALFLPRVGNFRPEATLSLVECLAQLGVSPLNPPSSIRLGRDHFATTLAMHQAGIPTPPTLVGSDPETLAQAARQFRLPVVVKTRRSRQGVGVIRCGSWPELEAVLDSLWRVGEEVVVQPFCFPGGVSFRVLVLEGKVLGVTRHTAKPGEFRSNAARGAEVQALESYSEAEELAKSAALVCGLTFCGVDLWPDGHRLLVGEVNPTPGWKHFAKATGVPVARLLVEAMARRALGAL